MNGNRILEPKTENVVKCHTNLIQSGRKVLFSANQSDEGVYWTECLSVVDSNGDFLVKVVNLNEKAISLENGMRIGSVTEDYQIVKGSKSYELKTVIIRSSAI